MKFHGSLHFRRETSQRSIKPRIEKAIRISIGLVPRGVSTRASCETVDEPAGQQPPPPPPQTSQLSKSRYPADTRSSTAFHLYERVILIFYCVSLGSPRYLEVGVRARLFKSVARKTSLSLSFFLRSRSTFRHLFVRHT